MANDDIVLQSCCRHLRHKMMYCDARHAPRGRVDDSSDTRVFFCVQTGETLGPDARAACLEACQSGRRCYQSGPGGEE